MEFTGSHDVKAVRGAEYLSDRPAPNGEEPGKTSAQGKKAAADKRKQALSGLDMGRRLLVVLKRDEVTGPAPGKRQQQTQVVRVMDHGAKQREAVRRLFDAQVLLKSYEEQLQESEAQVTSLQMKLSRAVQGEYKVIQDGDLALEKPKEPEDPQEIKRRELLDKIKQFKAGQELQEAAESGKVLIPFWLRQDEDSRVTVSKLADKINDAFQVEGTLDKAKLLEDLWSCGFEFAMRWAGNPSEEVQKSYENVMQKNRQMQKDALKESSMLRGHIGKVQQKFKVLQSQSRELQQNFGRLQALAQQQQAALMQLQRAGAMPGGMPGGGGGRGGALGGFGPSQGSASPTSMGAGGANRRGSAESTMSSRPEVTLDAAAAQRASEAAWKAMAAVGGGQEALNMGMTEFRGFNLPSVDSVVGKTNFDFTSMTLDGAPSYKDIASAERAEGGFIGVSDEDVEAMDNEIFEPLNQFDKETRELLIDAVNDKVRRILAMDPDNFKNGRMPYGIRPNKNSGELEEEMMELRKQVHALGRERDDAKRALDEALREIAALKGQKRPPPPKQEAAAPVQVAVEREEVEQLISEEGLQALYDQISRLEEQVGGKDMEIKMKQDSIDELQQQLKAKREEVAEHERELHMAKKKIEDLEKIIADDSKAQRILELENELKQAKLQKEAVAKKIPELEKKIKELEEDLSKTKQELKRLQSRPPPEPGQPMPETIVEVDWSEVKKAQGELKRLLGKVAEVTAMKASKDGQQAVEALGDGPDEEVVPKMQKALGQWVSEAVRSLDQFEIMVAELKMKANRPVTRETIVKEVAPQVEDRSAEVRELKKQNKEQQNEISRLLLLIDELRKRIEALEAVELDNPEVAEAVHSIMDKVGLKELMVAKRDGVKLKGVFERLWQDSVQRIQRYGLIKERVLLANSAFSAVTSAINGSAPEDIGDAIPDFERLSETTAATLKGMWYRTEHMFRRACEYAMTSGLEAEALRAQRELTEGIPYDQTDLIQDPAPTMKSWSGKRDGRLPGRRSERPRASPQKSQRSAAAPDMEAPSFASYVQAMREASARSEEPKASPSQTRPGASMDPNKSLKAAVHHSPGALASSRSLPALPKGRAMMASPDSEALNSPALSTSGFKTSAVLT